MIFYNLYLLFTAVGITVVVCVGCTRLVLNWIVSAEIHSRIRVAIGCGIDKIFTRGRSHDGGELHQADRHIERLNQVVAFFGCGGGRIVRRVRYSHQTHGQRFRRRNVYVAVQREHVIFGTQRRTAVKRVAQFVGCAKSRQRAVNVFRRRPAFCFVYERVLALFGVQHRVFIQHDLDVRYRRQVKIVAKYEIHFTAGFNFKCWRGGGGAGSERKPVIHGNRLCLRRIIGQIDIKRAPCQVTGTVNGGCGRAGGECYWRG